MNATPAPKPAVDPTADALCPRCRHDPIAAFPGDRGGSSRLTLERDVRVCGACASDEALRDARGLPPVPLGEWPVHAGSRITFPAPQ